MNHPSKIMFKLFKTLLVKIRHLFRIVSWVLPRSHLLPFCSGRHHPYSNNFYGWVFGLIILAFLPSTGTPVPGYVSSPHHLSPHPVRSGYQHFFGPNISFPPVNGGGQQSANTNSNQYNHQGHNPGMDNSQVITWGSSYWSHRHNRKVIYTCAHVSCEGHYYKAGPFITKPEPSSVHVHA